MGKRLFRSKVGRVVKVTQGLLAGKYVMIAKEFDEGCAVITESSEWPSDVPPEFNALFVSDKNLVDIPEEEETMVKVKFPNADQFE